MNTNFSLTYSTEIKEPKLSFLMQAFFKMMTTFLSEYFNQVLIQFAEYYMNSEDKPFKCDKCGNTHNFTWKTKHGKLTKIVTILKIIKIHQLQIKCKECDHKFYITRNLLGIEKRKVIPFETIRKLGLIGALTTFGISKKILSIFGVQLNKMTVWRAVQKSAKEIEFNIDPEEEATGEADGTGVPTIGIKKRGSEIKVFIQKKKSGGVRIAGLSIGKYDSEWEKLFAPLLDNLSTFKSFLLTTDGDTSIFKALKGKIEVKLQRCLWHIPHQLKWYLWKDKVKRKSDIWNSIMGKSYDIVNIHGLLEKDDAVIDKIIELKEKRLDELVDYCTESNYKSCATYLTNAKSDMFTAVKNRLEGKTTSRVERVMKTINARIKVGKWSRRGALNVNKIRLAHYYNDYMSEIE